MHFSVLPRAFSKCQRKLFSSRVSKKIRWANNGLRKIVGGRGGDWGGTENQKVNSNPPHYLTWSICFFHDVQIINLKKTKFNSRLYSLHQPRISDWLKLASTTFNAKSKYIINHKYNLINLFVCMCVLAPDPQNSSPFSHIKITSRLRKVTGY